MPRRAALSPAAPACDRQEIPRPLLLPLTGWETCSGWSEPCFRLDWVPSEYIRAVDTFLRLPQQERRGPVGHRQALSRCHTLHCPHIVLFLNCFYPHFSSKSFEVTHNKNTYGELIKFTERPGLGKQVREGGQSGKELGADEAWVSKLLMKKISSGFPGRQSEKRAWFLLLVGRNLPRF